MKIKALINVLEEMPEAKIVLESSDGERLYAAGFWVKKNCRDEAVIIIKVGKKLFL